MILCISVLSVVISPPSFLILLKNIVAGSGSLLQGIFPTQGSNPGLPHRRQILTSWAPQETHNSELCAGEISSNKARFPTISTVPYLRNPLRSTDRLRMIFLPDVQSTAPPGVKGEPDAVLRSPQNDLISHGIHTMQWCMWQHFQFTHEETEAQRACVTHPRSYSC